VEIIWLSAFSGAVIMKSVPDRVVETGGRKLVSKVLVVAGWGKKDTGMKESYFLTVWKCGLYPMLSSSDLEIDHGEL
jgi:hypothetical protein